MKNLSESDKMFVKLFEGAPHKVTSRNYQKVSETISKNLYHAVSLTPSMDEEQSFFFFDEKNSDETKMIFRYVHPEGKNIWMKLKRNIKYEFRNFRYGKVNVYDDRVEFLIDDFDPNSTGSPWTYGVRGIKMRPEILEERCYNQIKKRIELPILKNKKIEITKDHNIIISFNLKNKNNEISSDDMYVLYTLFKDIETITLGRYNMLSEITLGDTIFIRITKLLK